MERIAKALEIARQQRVSAEVLWRQAPERERKAANGQSAAAPPHVAVPPRAAAQLKPALTWSPDPDVLERHRIVTSHGHPAAAAYRMLRTRVLQRMRAEGKQVLAIASTGPDEGKTVTAVNLAYVLAADPKCRVVLLDLDLRRPSVGRCLGLEALPGIGRHLIGECELGATAARIAPFERLLVVPAHPIGSGSSELLATDAVRRMFAMLRATGPDTLVLCDVPPLFSTDDLLTLAPMLDVLLLVVGERQTDRDLLRRSTGFLPGVPLLGTVLNKSRDASAGDY